MNNIPNSDEYKNNFNYFFNNLNYSEITNLSDIIINNGKNNNIIFLGIGKSYNICLHFSDILKCINIPSIVMETSKMLHGDIGLLKENDIIILISNSGNTKELIDIVKIINDLKKCKIILLSSKKNGTLIDYCNHFFLIPVNNESTIGFNLIPTNSIINYIQYSNIILETIITKLNLTKQIYIENHHSGNIGDNYKKVKDNIIYKEKCCILTLNSTIKDVIINLNKNKLACCVIVNNEDNVIGIITDNDIRKYLENNDELLINIKNIVNYNFYFIDDENIFIKDLNTKYNYIPIIKNKKLFALFNLNY